MLLASDDFLLSSLSCLLLFPCFKDLYVCEAVERVQGVHELVPNLLQMRWNSSLCLKDSTYRLGTNDIDDINCCLSDRGRGMKEGERQREEASGMRGKM